MFGSGRAILTLRESYRKDLRQVKAATDLAYVRFHAIFHDEVGLYDEDDAGRARYNFSYIDQIYDGLLANGVRPFVELSFMPSKLAAQPSFHPFWYKPIVSPPRDWQQWRELIARFAQHLIDRYGEAEVSQWYFEVWNEPNIDFWAGEPKQSTYFRLYDEAATAIKRVNASLRVGGPATAQAAWIEPFIAHAVAGRVPLDFVSTHVYGDDEARNVLGRDEAISRTDMVARAVRMVHDQVKASARPDLPIIWSEYNATYRTDPDTTDLPFMAPWIANTIRQCDELTEMMSYWTFSDVFEEQGVIREPFYGGYGILAEFGLPKPSFNAFALLHQLGDERVDIGSSSAIATRRANGALVFALWNLQMPETRTDGAAKSFDLEGLGRHRDAIIRRVDPSISVLAKYETLGRPRTPSASEVDALRRFAQIAPAEHRVVEAGRLTVTIPAQALAVVELP
jgi:xylan 1,4-beta-xylosidase